MAASVVGAELTALQRRAQLAVRNQAVAAVTQAWPALDPTNLDVTAPGWVALLLQVVGQWRAQSAQSAASYYLALRRAETDQLVDPTLMLATGANRAAVTTSLMVTGPIGIKQRLARGVDPEQASKLAMVETSGAVARHVLDGGRQTLVNAVESDSAAVGFARVTGPKPCGFCAMLASRGFAYKSRESALLTGRRSKLGADQRYHDHCACSVEPAFEHGTTLPGRSQEFADMWAKATRGRSGKTAVDAFAKALDASHAAPAA